MTESEKKKRALAVALVEAIAETIKEFGEVPSGHLYAALMGHMDLDTYQTIIDGLKRGGLVSERNNLLKWTGPK